jgi:hypothetical protein
MKIGPLGILFVVFLVLKLTNQINWSWWWVTSPLWIPVILIGVVAVALGIVMVAVKLVNL